MTLDSITEIQANIESISSIIAKLKPCKIGIEESVY